MGSDSVGGLQSAVFASLRHIRPQLFRYKLLFRFLIYKRHALDMISIIDYACSACLFYIIIIVHRGLYLALHCRGHFNSFSSSEPKAHRCAYSIPMLRRPSVVRPSVVRPSSSTISKIFSETTGPIVLILHIHHLQVGGKNNCVFVLIG